MVLVLEQLPVLPAFLESKPKQAFNMKSTTLITAALAALIPIVQADNCKPGLYYCGYGLLKKGWFLSLVTCIRSQKHAKLIQGTTTPRSMNNS